MKRKRPTIIDITILKHIPQLANKVNTAESEIKHKNVLKKKKEKIFNINRNNHVFVFTQLEELLM